MSDAPRHRFTVAPDEAGRIDKLLARRFPGTSRRRLAAFFAERRVRIGGAVASKGDLAPAGAEVTVEGEPPGVDDLRPVPEPDAPLEVLHEDARLVVVNKPPGAPSHPLRAGETGTLAGALVARYPECAGAGADPREAGLVHRLDIGTSGAIAAARDAAAWRALRDAFAAGRVRKQYLALVVGAAEAGESFDPVHGQSAHTSWEVEQRLPGHTLLRCATHTGRRHQVRVHLAGAGWPIAGDPRHGGGEPPPPLVGHFLHASELELPHPDGGRVSVTAPLPPDRAGLLARLSGSPRP